MQNYKVLKIITAILFIIATAYSVWMLADIIVDSKTNGWAGLGMIAWIVVAAIALAIPLIVALIGLISSIIKCSKSLCTIGTLVYFIVFTLLPLVVYFGCILAFNLIA